MIQARSLRVTFLLLLASMALAQPGFAVLGGKEESVELDRQIFSGGKDTATSYEAFTVHEFVSGGVTVREYASPSGTIFGLVWKGVNHPDLSSILGGYYSDYRKISTSRIKKRGHHPYSMTQSPSVIVEKFGHMRAVHGKAYVPALFPEGVSAFDIQ